MVQVSYGSSTLKFHTTRCVAAHLLSNTFTTSCQFIKLPHTSFCSGICKQPFSIARCAYHGGIWMPNHVPLGEVIVVPQGMSKIAGREHPDLLSPQLLFRFAVMEAIKNLVLAMSQRNHSSGPDSDYSWLKVIVISQYNKVLVALKSLISKSFSQTMWEKIRDLIMLIEGVKKIQCYQDVWLLSKQAWK